MVWIWNVHQRLTLEHLSSSWWYCMERLWCLSEVQPVWMKSHWGKFLKLYSLALFPVSLCFLSVYVVWAASLPLLPPDGPFALPCLLNCDDGILRKFKPKKKPSYLQDVLKKILKIPSVRVSLFTYLLLTRVYNYIILLLWLGDARVWKSEESFQELFSPPHRYPTQVIRLVRHLLPSGSIAQAVCWAFLSHKRKKNWGRNW